MSSYMFATIHVGRKTYARTGKAETQVANIDYHAHQYTYSKDASLYSLMCNMYVRVTWGHVHIIIP